MNLMYPNFEECNQISRFPSCFCRGWLWLRKFKLLIKNWCLFFWELVSHLGNLWFSKFLIKFGKLLSCNDKQEEVYWGCPQVWAIWESKAVFVIDLGVIWNIFVCQLTIVCNMFTLISFKMPYCWYNASRKGMRSSRIGQLVL